MSPRPFAWSGGPPRPVLPALAVADVDVLDAINHRSQRRDGVLTSAIDVAGIHVQPERRRCDRVEHLERGRRVVDGMTDVRLHAEHHAIVLRAVRQPAKRVDDLIERHGIVSCASLARS